MLPRWLSSLLLLFREAWSARRDVHLRFLKRVQTPWRKFIIIHMNVMVATDFFCKTIWTPLGKRVAYVGCASKRIRRAVWVCIGAGPSLPLSHAARRLGMLMAVLLFQDLQQSVSNRLEMVWPRFPSPEEIVPVAPVSMWRS